MSERVGRYALAAGGQWVAMRGFVGENALALTGWIAHPARFRWFTARVTWSRPHSSAVRSPVTVLKCSPGTRPGGTGSSTLLGRGGPTSGRIATPSAAEVIRGVVHSSVTRGRAR